jgi:hypothetical protein
VEEAGILEQEKRRRIDQLELALINHETCKKR